MNKAVEVLIVEDDVRIAHIHRKFIERIEGFDIIGIAHSAEESFDWIESFQPDLVLLDVYFPDKLGTDILVFIKEKSPNTDVIFITAAAETEILKKAFRGGVVDYILKPLTFERFKQSLEAYLEKRVLLEQKDKLTEYEIEAIWRYSSGQVAVSSLTPKGIDPLTKDKIVEHLKTSTEGISAEELGKQLGISRSTARRYLEYLVTESIVITELLYGTVGRPERRYLIATK